MRSTPVRRTTPTYSVFCFLFFFSIRSNLILDGRKVVVSNASMLGRDIVNYTKSRNFGFGIEIWIKADTPIDKIQLLRQRLTDYQKLLPQV